MHCCCCCCVNPNWFEFELLLKVCCVAIRRTHTHLTHYPEKGAHQKERHSRDGCHASQPRSKYLKREPCSHQTACTHKAHSCKGATKQPGETMLQEVGHAAQQAVSNTTTQQHNSGTDTDLPPRWSGLLEYTYTTNPGIRAPTSDHLAEPPD